MFIIRKISWIKSIILCCVRLNTKISVFISILAYLLFENQLTAPKVFMLLSLYDLLKTNLVEFLPMSIMFLLEAKVSIHRIQEFLLLPEVDKYRLENSFLENDLHNQKITIGNSIANATGFENNTEEIICDVEPPKMALVMKNVSAFWKNLDPTDSNYKIALQNISLEVSSGELLTIIGLVGSGKSSILHAILGEIKTDPGSSIRLSGPVSYSSQIPWAFEASIQQNILMGEEMNRKRYKEVIKCCQLEKDLSSWKHGDRTIVGERGVSLSGGQRTRLSLARCVYREAHLYLLDDPLSSVDACVARELFDKCLRGLLKESAVVLVTHQLNLLKGTDQICLMQEGKMLFKGLFEDLQSSSSRFSQFLQDNTKPNRETNRDAYKQHHTEDTHLLDDSKISEGSTEDLTSSTECLIHPPEEAQQIGAVKASVYSKYFKSGANSFGLLLLAMLFSLGQASFSISDLWISHWVDLEERNNTYGIQYHTNISSELHIPAQISYNLYNQVFILIDLWSFSRRQCIYIYAGLISTSILLILTELLIFFNITTKSSITLHDSMFRGLLRTTMKFFNQTTSGKILNRVSKDMGTTDSVLPAAIVDCIGFFLEIVGILIVVCIVNVWLLIPTALLVIILAIMRGVFISTSRSLKRLEAICRSPAFTHVSATLEGLDTIRASNLRGQLTAEFDCHLDLHSSAWTLIINTNRGFSLWVDIFCCFYLAAITFSFLLFFEDATYGGSVGLAVTQVMALIDKCQWGLKQAAEMENQMTSIERIVEYSNLDSEPALNTDEGIFKFKYPNINLDRWPQKGTLLFKEINLKYDENNYVLQNINFDVQNREKVGIIGRTGAGKSSIISALFRLTDTEGIIEIDGVDTKDVGLHKLRSSMSIIPQEPFIFNGSLRQNLDPRNEYSDENLWNSLDEVELKSLVSNLSGGLDAIISDSGSNLSVGERQLLSLARASLRKSHFLIMDEATANVDPETDQLIQQTIRRKFSDKTVLTIAHRLHTVIKSDKMIVMDRGRIVEFGHPYELIVNSNQQNSPHSLKYTQNNKSNTSLFYDKKQKQNKNSNHSIFNSLLNEQSTNDLLYKIAEENYSTKESQQSTGKINELKM